MKKGSPSWAPLCSLLRVFDGPRLADHGDPDLTRKAELCFDPLGYIPCHQLSSCVIDLLRLDQDPDLATGLDGVGLLHALERVGDLFELLEPLDVCLERLASRAGPRGRDGVCRDEKYRLDRSEEHTSELQSQSNL